MSVQTVIIEMGFNRVRAGLSTSDVPTVSFAADLKWTSFPESNALAIFTQVFSALKVAPADCCVIVSHIVASTNIRPTMAKVLMGTLKVKSMYVANDTTQALQSADKLGNNNTLVVLCEPSMMTINAYIGGIRQPQACLTNFISNVPYNDYNISQLTISIQESIRTIGVDYRRELYNNIYLFGAYFLDAALVARMESEVYEALPNQYASCHLYCPASPETAVWRGGKAFSLIEGFSDFCFSQADFAAGGAAFINQKIF